jgi:hypothetical protein
MRGFGGEGPRRRTATLRSYRPFDEHRRQAALPAAYRELIEDARRRSRARSARQSPRRPRPSPPRSQRC